MVQDSKSDLVALDYDATFYWWIVCVELVIRVCVVYCAGLPMTRPWVQAPLVPTCLCYWSRYLVSIASLTWVNQEAEGVGRGKYYNLSVAFIKNGTPIQIRLKVPFSSNLFFTIRVKKLQITFSSRLNSFSTNSNKVLIDFTHNFAHSAPGSLLVKSFSHNRSSRHHFWHWPIKAPQGKPAVKIAPLSQSEIVSYELNINKDGDLSKIKRFFSAQFSFFFTKPCHFLKKSTLFSCNWCLKEFIEESFVAFSVFLFVLLLFLMPKIMTNIGNLAVCQKVALNLIFTL